MEDVKNIIESLLFVAEDSLTIDSIKKVLDSTDSNVIRNVLNELSSEYEARKGGFFLREVAGGYQIRTRPEYSQWIRRLLRPKPLRLSNATLETLAIVAYKQPVIRSDIEHLRGVDCGGILRMLLERKLIRVVGRKEIPGRPMIYMTTKKFLELFELKDIKDLPSPKEIEELGNSSSETLAYTASDIIEQTTEED
jgi:segregation and condensation protein B